MTHKTTLTYLFDPLCGWCYGASAGIAELDRHPSVDLIPMPTGLFAGRGARPMKGFAAHAWAMDQRISTLSGQPFSEAYRRDVLGAEGASLDSTVATRALIAVAQTEPNRVIEALRTIQTARYVEGRDITSAKVVAGLLAEMGLTEAAERLLAPDAPLLARLDRTVAAARKLMATHGLQGVPSIIATVDGTPRVLEAGALHAGSDRLLSRLALE